MRHTISFVECNKWMRKSQNQPITDGREKNAMQRAAIIEIIIDGKYVFRVLFCAVFGVDVNFHAVSNIGVLSIFVWRNMSAQCGCNLAMFRHSQIDDWRENSPNKLRPRLRLDCMEIMSSRPITYYYFAIVAFRYFIVIRRWFFRQETCASEWHARLCIHIHDYK